MNATTQAHKARAQHVQRAKGELAYLTKFVKELEKNTAHEPSWNWVGDWQALAAAIDAVADQAESMARNSRKVPA